jgi:hypothetical protein
MSTAKVLSNQIIHNASVSQAATVYSDVVKADLSNGEVALEIVSSAGSITVTQQCSIDGYAWSDPVDGAGNALGAVVAAMTVGTKYVVPSAVVAPLIRYKIVEGNTAATVVKLRLIFQEEVV